MTHPRTDQSEATQSETPSSEAMAAANAPLLRTIDPAGLARFMAMCAIRHEHRAQRFFEGVNPDDIVLMFTLWISMYEENADAS